MGLRSCIDSFKNLERKWFNHIMLYLTKLNSSCEHCISRAIINCTEYRYCRQKVFVNLSRLDRSVRCGSPILNKQITSIYRKIGAFLRLLVAIAIEDRERKQNFIYLYRLV